jgi:hypothetical protein
VHLFVDASYGVHADERSHTGSCVVIGDLGAVLKVVQAAGGDQELNGGGASGNV